MGTKSTAQMLDAVTEQIDSLEDPYDAADTAAVEVQLDAVATALARVHARERRKSVSESDEDLATVLSNFVEAGLIKPAAITIYEEIENVICLKDYEGYSDEYVKERLQALLSDLADALRPAIKALRNEAKP
jgi:hypothetical protein